MSEDATDVTIVEKKYYDFNLDVEHIMDCTKESGWPVSKKRQNFQGVRVGIIGFYNKGKTFILSRLADIVLPSDLNSSTNFLAVKETKILDNFYVLCDSAGKGQPLKVESFDEHTNRAALEDLLDNVILNMSEYFIIVVNDLTWEDQVFIAKVAEQFRARGNGGVHQLVVIHNWYHINYTQVEEHFTKYIDTKYVGRKKIIGQLESDSHDPIPVFVYSTKEKNTKGSVVYINHYFLVGEKNESEMDKAYNDIVFGYLKESFNILFPPIVAHKSRDIAKDLENYLNTILSKYFTSHSTPDADLKITFHDTEEPCFRIANGEQFHSKTIQISSVLTQYPSSVINLPSIVYQKGEIQELLLNIECPSLNLEKLKDESESSISIQGQRFDIKLEKKNQFDMSEFGYIKSDKIDLVRPVYGEASKTYKPKTSEWIPDVNPHLYYDDGVLTVQILSQKVNSKSELGLSPIDKVHQFSPEEFNRYLTKEEELRNLNEELIKLRREIDIVRDGVNKLRELEYYKNWSNDMEKLKEEVLYFKNGPKESKDLVLELEDQLNVLLGGEKFENYYHQLLSAEPFDRNIAYLEQLLSDIPDFCDMDKEIEIYKEKLVKVQTCLVNLLSNQVTNWFGEINNFKKRINDLNQSPVSSWKTTVIDLEEKHKTLQENHLIIMGQCNWVRKGLAEGSESDGSGIRANIEMITTIHDELNSALKMIDNISFKELKEKEIRSQTKPTNPKIQKPDPKTQKPDQDSQCIIQ